MNIDDVVYFASFELRPKWVECPDCFGTKTLKVILANGEEHTIDCAGCKGGYEPPRGVVQRYEHEPKVEKYTVTGLEIRDGVTRYFSGNRVLDPEDTFTDELMAWQRAEIKAQEYVAEQNRRIMTKEKDTRTWAWNVSYHRQCIKRAEKDLAYHTSKLNAALPHVKEEKKA